MGVFLRIFRLDTASRFRLDLAVEAASCDTRHHQQYGVSTGTRHPSPTVTSQVTESSSPSVISKFRRRSSVFQHSNSTEILNHVCGEVSILQLHEAKGWSEPAVALMVVCLCSHAATWVAKSGQSVNHQPKGSEAAGSPSGKPRGGTAC